MGKRLWVERNKDGSWDAFSDDGAHIKFGKGRGQFTPGDLMKVALAGCAALTPTSVSTSRWSSTPPTPV